MSEMADTKPYKCKVCGIYLWNDAEDKEYCQYHEDYREYAHIPKKEIQDDIGGKRVMEERNKIDTWKEEAICPYCDHTFQQEDDFCVSSTDKINVGIGEIYKDCPKCDQEFELFIRVQYEYYTKSLKEEEEEDDGRKEK